MLPADFCDKKCERNSFRWKENDARWKLISIQRNKSIENGIMWGIKNTFSSYLNFFKIFDFWKAKITVLNCEVYKIHKSKKCMTKILQRIEGEYGSIHHKVLIYEVV